MSHTKYPADSDLIVRAVLVSEVISGCTLTIDGGGTKFSIASGTLRFVTINAAGLASVITLIFPGKSAITPTQANQGHFITIDKNLAVTQNLAVQEYTDLEANIQIGVVFTATTI